MEWEWYRTRDMFHSFCHLIMKANWVDKKDRGQLIKRGSFISNVRELSSQTGISGQRWKTIIARLQQTGEINIQTTNKYTLYVINNYDYFQTWVYENGENQQTANKQTINKTVQADEIIEETGPEEDKEDKEYKNYYIVVEKADKTDLSDGLPKEEKIENDVSEINGKFKRTAQQRLIDEASKFRRNHMDYKFVEDFLAPWFNEKPDRITKVNLNRFIVSYKKLYTPPTGKVFTDAIIPNIVSAFNEARLKYQLEQDQMKEWKELIKGELNEKA